MGKLVAMTEMRERCGLADEGSDWKCLGNVLACSGSYPSLGLDSGAGLRRVYFTSSASKFTAPL